MKLQTKYSLAILALVLALGVSFSGIQLWYYRASLDSFAITGSEAIEHAMMAELQAKQKLLVQVLATALTNPFYRLDMAKIAEIISGVKQHNDVRDVYVYDKEGNIIHDSTNDLSLYGKPLGRKSTQKALEQKQVAIETSPNTLIIDAPILIADEGLLGGISVAFSLQSIKFDIEKRKRNLGEEIQGITRKELGVLLVVAIVFSVIGLGVSIFLGRAWSRPIQILSALTEKVGKGDYDVAIPIHRSDEIGQLAQSFSSMVSSLKELRRKEAEQSEAMRGINSQLQKTNEELVWEVAERQRAEQKVLHQNRQLEVLYEIDSAISSTLDRRVLLDLLFDKIESLLPYAALTVRLLNDETKQLEPISARNIDVQEWAKGLESRTAITGQGFSQEVIQKKTPLVIENVQTDPRCWNRELFRKNGLVSYIGLPLSTEGKILGVLGFYLQEQHSFPKEEVEFLSTLAGQVAIGINNAQLYEKIKKQASELEEANQAKDEFLSVMSHELRTPLNVITGYAEVLSQGVLGEIQREQLHAVKTISFQSRELLRMINEILQVGSIEAGKVKATCREVNISDFLEEVKSGYEILSKKEILLEWNVPSRLPIVRTDGEKLKHVLQNLINNALKFTENGSVTVSAECSSEFIEFQVKDTGIGMPQDMLPSIFQMFRQLDSSSTRSYGGSGVGLYIVKKFVDLLGGKIEVESTLGEGSTFTVTLPLEVSETIRTNPDEDLAVKLAG